MGRRRWKYRALRCMQTGRCELQRGGSGVKLRGGGGEEMVKRWKEEETEHKMSPATNCKGLNNTHTQQNSVGTHVPALTHTYKYIHKIKNSVLQSDSQSGSDIKVATEKAAEAVEAQTHTGKHTLAYSQLLLELSTHLCRQFRCTLVPAANCHTRCLSFPSLSSFLPFVRVRVCVHCFFL